MESVKTSGGFPPRVLIVQPAQWPRALLRAALRHEGYDALGAADLGEALTYPASEERRGPLQLIILDQAALEGHDSLWAQLKQRYADAQTLMLESAFHPSMRESWPNVLRHPVTIAEIVEATQKLLPLPSTAAHPLD